MSLHASYRFLNSALREVSSRNLHVSDNYPIGVKQNVNNYDSVMHARGDFFAELHGWRDELTSGDFFNSKPRTTEFPFLYQTATFEKQRILKAKETCENQFDNNKVNSLFAARRNLLQRCER